SGIQKLQGIYQTPKHQLSECQRKTADLAEAAGRLLTEFEARVREEKKRKGILTFNDISRYALRLLVDENGNDTPLALAKKKDFDAIYIDEYQDVDAVQDRIFEALSGGKNRFMVGDIKQSIYAFRGAEPMVFANLRRTYAPLDEAAPGAPASLFMSENFRCSQEIIDFTNRIFDALMPKISPEIGYKAADALVHGKDAENFPVPVKLILCEKAPKGQPPAPREAEYIAGEIERLVREEKKQDGSPIRYDDVLILLRSPKVKQGELLRVLSAHGIPVSAESKSDLLSASEIKLALCLLGVIDNPRNDTALCGLLLSPLCGVSPDYLALLRKNRGSDRLCTSLCKDLASGDADDENRAKVRALFDEIAQFRALSRYASAADLFDEVCERFGLFTRIAGKNPIRRANLELLRNLAAGAGESGRTLSDFMRFIKNLEESSDNRPTAAPPGAVGGAVRIMTVHHSKGLEAPVVFFADADHPYKENDAPKFYYDNKAGFALELRDESNYYAYKHLPLLAVRQKIIMDQRQEELRTLYVALTRARERLYVTADVAKPAEYAAKIGFDSRIGVRYAARKQKSLLALILQVIGADLPDELPSGKPIRLYDDC
ncbi:MAG: UvrD-helicase domain-containing protein, partial [Clostridia bacterium]|nr:UvrD-helicase domain-containing protein [Clostridia bacterium]